MKLRKHLLTGVAVLFVAVIAVLHFGFQPSNPVNVVKEMVEQVPAPADPSPAVSEQILAPGAKSASQHRLNMRRIETAFSGRRGVAPAVPTQQNVRIRADQMLATVNGVAITLKELVPMNLPARQPGAAKGKAAVTPAFFDPLPEDEIKAWDGR